MILIRSIIISIVIIIVGVCIWLYSWKILILYIITIFIIEVLSNLVVNNLRKNFQWLITKKDEYPLIDKNGLKKFINHGFDPVLGWIRKPNTQKKETGKFGETTYHIGEQGYRKNPGHEKLSKKISCYGDSFAFCRQVNDDETWEWNLSNLTKTNVLNFAVGNYGIDQSYLRLVREYPKNRTKIVIMGVVPSTIVRILCVWKHYNEYGNTFGFKPRFIIKEDNLEVIRNIIDNPEKIEKYLKYLPEIRKYDYFYKSKFKKEMIRFPYIVSILSQPLRNIPLILLVSWHKFLSKKEVVGYPAPMKKIMGINLTLRYSLFTKNKPSVQLITKIVEKFKKYSQEKNFIPILLWMPQKDDLLMCRKKGSCYYGNFISNIKQQISTIDLTNYLIKRKDLDKIYSDDNKYGGHYSKFGNRLVAGIIYKELEQKEFL